MDERSERGAGPSLDPAAAADGGLGPVVDALSVLPADDLGALVATAVKGIGWAGSATVFLSDYQELVLTPLDAAAQGQRGLRSASRAAWPVEPS
jgi:hypothetical protein